MSLYTFILRKAYVYFMAFDIDDAWDNIISSNDEHFNEYLRNMLIAYYI